MQDKDDEFFTNADERRIINDNAADRVALLENLSLVAGELGLDISSAVAEAKRDICSDEGVELRDYDMVFDQVDALVGSCPVAAAESILAELVAAEAKRERAGVREFRRALPAMRAYVFGGAA